MAELLLLSKANLLPVALLHVALQVLPFEQQYLDALPSAQMYEKSYMHRDTVTHVVVSMQAASAGSCTLRTQQQLQLQLQRAMEPGDTQQLVTAQLQLLLVPFGVV
jgi:hypothetical protein